MIKLSVLISLFIAAVSAQCASAQSGPVVLDCYGVEDGALETVQIIQDISGKYVYSAQSCTPLSPDGTPTEDATCKTSSGEIRRTGAGLSFETIGLDVSIHPTCGQLILFEDHLNQMEMHFHHTSCKFQ